MGKLCEKFWESINPAYACINELVALPENGDCGFIEYFEYKAAKIVDEKKIFAPFASQNKLMLEFPEPDCKEVNVFEKFFESPSVIAENHNFEGLFAVDISNYVNNLDHDRFLSLISYMKSNPQTVYVLFFYSDDENEIQRIYRNLLHHIDIIKTVLPKPDKQQLVEYTMLGLEQLSGKLDDGIREFFCDYYEKNHVGYDSADYLIRHLKLSGFKGSLSEIKEKMANLDLQSATSGSYSGLGY